MPSAESADDTQVGGVPDAPAGYAAVQVDGDRLEKQANQNLMKLKGKHQVLRFGRNNPQTLKHQHEAGKQPHIKKRSWGS